MGNTVLGAPSALELRSADCVLAQVYSPNLPPAPVLPSSAPPYAPVSQPTPQFILQGSLPLAGCWVTQSSAPVPTVLTTASEPAGHAAATNNSEEKTAVPRPATEKAKNEEVRPTPPCPVLAQAGRQRERPRVKVPSASGLATQPPGRRVLTPVPAPST